MGAGLGGGGEDAFDLAVVERRDDRRHQDTDRDARGGKLTNRFEASRRRRRPRLEATRQPPVEGGNRDVNPRQAPRRHRRQDIDIANDKRRLGDDTNWMIVRCQHLERRG